MAGPERENQVPILQIVIFLGLLVIFIWLFVFPYGGHHHSRLGSNLSSAIGSLKSINTGQKQFRNAGMLDVDGNETGEFGFLHELAGEKGGRLDPEVEASIMESPFIPQILGVIREGKGATKSGYWFRVFLPVAGGIPLGEGEEGKNEMENKTDSETTRLREKGYLVYAWPRTFGRTGDRIFVTSQEGIIFEKETLQDPFNGQPVPWGFASPRLDPARGIVLDEDALLAAGWEEIG